MTGWLGLTEAQRRAALRKDLAEGYDVIISGAGPVGLFLTCELVWPDVQS